MRLMLNVDAEFAWEHKINDDLTISSVRQERH